jgi:hypothetical protein
MVEQAMAFAHALLSAKDKFLEFHPAPEAIDIGLSCGVAFVGALGPESQTKATALGDVPGKARRFQCAGKQFREFLGEKDRIVFDHQVGSLTQISRQEILLNDSQMIRNIDDRSLLYIELKSA